MKKNTFVLYLFFLLIMQIAHAQVPLLYGLTSSGGHNGDGAIIMVNVNGNGFDTLYSFSFAQRLGYQPQGSLLNVSNDSLYGMTFLGGLTDFGVIFSFNPATNTYRDLHDFNDTAGSNPEGNLILASNGKLYGLTSTGGANLFGVLFSFDPTTHSYVDLHDFSGSAGSDGQNPTGNLIQVGNKLYGITSAGGSSTYGVIFNFNLPGGIYSKLCDVAPNGGVSYGSLVNANNGKLYGLASSGGMYSSGEIFSFDTTGNVYSDVYDFDGASNGSSPHGSLLLASDGNLYGMTELGGNNGSGIIFRFNPDSTTFKKLYDFDGVMGSEPYGSLLQGSDSKLYGMTSMGGSDSLGNIFSFDLTDNLITNFTSFNDTLGAEPHGDLIEVPTFSGINQLLLSNEKLLIYPNPANGEITIASEKNIGELKVTNVLGQIIYMAQPEQKQCTINIKDEGVYFITVTSNNQTTTRGVLVDK